ncbi:2OG-Fe(II) oxygenase [Oscillatoria sp. HE19RPO]|uniref:2OG-Fe(II) oxygenase n=1 Tax=Oscillatoria sp. HE19RPO TaxID=2954806 RepID=UPI0020C2BBBA|nr:2OG-Fe(II) oxygenase [Oscillatoria sp. HE19RPO]
MLDQLTLFERLGVFVMRDFLDRQLCQQILAETRQAKKFRPGEIHLGQGKSAVDETIRKVEQTKLSPSIVETVGQKLGAIKHQLEAKFKVKLDACQGPNFLFYRKGGCYLPHKDRDFGKDYQYVNQRRRVSTIIFVNGEGQTGDCDSANIETYEGGALMFYGLLKDEKAARLGLSLNGQRGLLIAFDSAIVHEVKPVTAGERLTIVNWFLGEEESEKGKGS